MPPRQGLGGGSAVLGYRDHCVVDGGKVRVLWFHAQFTGISNKEGLKSGLFVEENAVAKKALIAVQLRPWAQGDLPLLERLMGDPVKTGHLGGPETREQILERHERYVRSRETSRTGPIYAITIGANSQAVGSIGYWQRVWQGQHLWEVRWALLPEYQGQGIVASAIGLLASHARTIGKTRFLHAFPAVDNEATNAICRNAGFELLEEVEFEFGPGHTRRRNDWRLDLFAAIA